MKHSLYFPTIFMSLCALACGLMVWYTPLQLDDLCYGYDCRQALMAGETSFSLSDFAAFVKWHYIEVNGRLGDKLIHLILCGIPRYIFAAIAALAAMSIYWFSSLTAFGSVRRHPLRSAWLTAALTLFLPWGSYMYITNMFLNYPLGSSLMVIAVWAFVRLPSGGFLMRLSCVVAAFLAAAWHEACCVPMLTGMTLYLIIARERPRGLRLALLLGVIAGFLFVFTAPGFWIRLENIDATDSILIRDYFVPALVKGCNVMLLLPLMLGTCLALPRLRRRLTRPVVSYAAFATAMLVAALGIYLRSMYVMRIFWYADIVVLSGMAMLFFCYITPGRRPRLRLLLTALTAIVVLIHSATAIAVQRSYTREYREITRMFCASPDGLVYYDFHGKGFGPLIALRKARIYQLYSEFRTSYSRFYRTDSVTLSLVPTALRGISSHDVSSDSVIRPVRGYFVSSLSEFRGSDRTWPTCEFDDGSSATITVMIAPFPSAEGDTLYYLEPDARHIYPHKVTRLILHGR